MTYDLGLAKAPGNDTRLWVARMIRASKNDVRRSGRIVSRETVMAYLYWYCVEQKVKYRESPAIAGWYDRVGLYAIERTRRPGQ